MAAGKADAGLGLRATAEVLGLGFVELGEEAVAVLGNPERAGKPGVAALGEVLEDLGPIVDGLAGYRV